MIEVNRTDEQPVEVCLEPAVSPGDSLRARTRWKVKMLQPSGEIGLYAVWMASGAEQSRQKLSVVSAVTSDTDLNEAIEAPDGADAVKLCVRVDAKRSITILSRARIKSAGDDD